MSTSEFSPVLQLHQICHMWISVCLPFSVSLCCSYNFILSWSLLYTCTHIPESQTSPARRLILCFHQVLIHSGATACVLLTLCTGLGPSPNRHIPSLLFQVYSAIQMYCLSVSKPKVGGKDNREWLCLPVFSSSSPSLINTACLASPHQSWMPGSPRMRWHLVNNPLARKHFGGKVCLLRQSELNACTKQGQSLWLRLVAKKRMN